MDMNVILGSSANYLPFTATTIASVCHHIVDGSKVNFHIMHAGDVTEPQMERFRVNLATFSDKATFQFVEVHDTLNLAKRISTSGYIKGVATYLRLYIPELFKGRFSRALYLDSDIVACRNLGMLYRQEMHGCSIAGVEDYRSVTKLDSLWLPLSDKYINAGVLLLDLDALDHKEMLNRLNNVANSLIKYMINMGDQDLLSLLFHDRLVYIDPHWNVLVQNSPNWRMSLRERAGGINYASRDVVEDCLKDPFVIHYVGKVKPWTISWYHDPLSFRWYDYARMTGYFDRTMERVENRMWWLSPFRMAYDCVSFLPRIWDQRRSYSTPSHAMDYSPLRNKPSFATDAIQSQLDSLFRRNAAGLQKSAPGFMEARGEDTRIYFLSDASEYRINGVKCFGRPSLKSTRFIPITGFKTGRPPGMVLVDSLDLSAAEKKIDLAEKCLSSGSRLLMMEPGPVSTIMERCPLQGVPARYRRRHSLRFDDMAFSFDTRVASRFSEFLESPDSDITDAMRARCQWAINYMVANRLSVYNYLPLEPESLAEREGKAVLVIDQGEGDPAVLRSRVDANWFSRTLNAAMRENPGREILVYRSGLGSGAGHLRKLPRAPNLHLIDEQVNHYTLLDKADKVYTCNSHIGFEALLVGKRVVTFTDSFYSGWGLTDDRNAAIARRRRHSLEELFHAVVFRNVVYFSPYAPERVQPEQFLEEMVKLRDEYFGWASRWG